MKTRDAYASKNYFMLKKIVEDFWLKSLVKTMSKIIFGKKSCWSKMNFYQKIFVLKIIFCRKKVWSKLINDEKK